MTERRSSGRKAGAVFFVFVSCMALLLLGEAYVRFRLVGPEIRGRGAEALWRAYGNSFVQPNNGLDGDCGWEDELTPHPYLGWVNSKLPPCAVTGNNIGMPDKQDIPMARDPAYYTVILVGGSVASLMDIGSRNWLEEALNARFVSPNGQPFRVLSGALGAWSFPAQLNFLLLYGQGADAVVALDGYNEMKPGQFPITWPSTSLFLYSSRPARLGWEYGAILSLRHLRSFALAMWPLRHSFFAYFAYQNVVERAHGILTEKSYQLIDRYFFFPNDWSQERREEWNRSKYRLYLLQLKALAEASGMSYAHFVQPIPQIGKELTTEEKALLGNLKLSNEYYQRAFVGPSEELGRRGVHTRSLVDVFRKERGTIYADQIHYKWDGLYSRGYDLVSSEMAENIGRWWGLKRKSSSKK